MGFLNGFGVGSVRVLSLFQARAINIAIQPFRPVTIYVPSRFDAAIVHDESSFDLVKFLGYEADGIGVVFEIRQV